jgi:O-antigen ligase
MSVTLLAWPALAWLLMRQERAAAILLALAVVCAVLLAGSPAAVLALLVGAVGFGLAAVAPRVMVPLVAWLLVLAVVAAPLLPFALTALANSFFGGDVTMLKSLVVWRDSVLAEPVRLITGHGLDTALRSQLAGILPLGAPQSILFEIWYELGLLGALPVAFLLASAALAARGLGDAIAPCLIGAILNVLAFACLGLVGSQTWWLTLIAVASVAFTAVIHGRFGTRRPKAVLGR